ncbi:MAG: aminotransferase class I/II-fold pyridoxal phosphate-dependent enzyme [Defluviitaleaceae bacterium]|nr:aminotransferase class I/II-fold pyridoxal phosphate-dependent enzyme [Defluviitaleaceae bacterium]
MQALQELSRRRVVPFDVPGHKRGRGNPDLAAFLGEKALSLDVNSMKPLDLLGNPVSVIKEAEELAAAAFGAHHAFFMVGGTTSSVQAMILAACKAGDKILLPRNVHKSVPTALILSGAVPHYIYPDTDKNLGISLGMCFDDIKTAIEDNKDAKAILLNNPTYYGICSNLKGVVELAHKYGMLVLVDEAHGTHFYFGDNLPISAMAAGADMAAVSMHKSGGSLTQSSILLLGKDVDNGYMRQIINLTQTTSASYLLMVSLDISRRNLALHGKKIFKQVIDYANYAREEINHISGFYAFGKELINSSSIYDFDTTKLSVNTLKTGLAGIEVYDILRDDYDIQIEFGDIGNILAYISVGDSKKDIERLCSALSEVVRIHGKPPKGMLNYEYTHPQLIITPQAAFYGEKELLDLKNSKGRISGELVLCYPPGIPVLAPGELITAEALDYVEYAKEKGCSLSGTQDPNVEKILVVK